jgi:hypothetical protein
VANLNAEQVDGHDAGTAAGNVLVLDGSGLVPTGNIPDLSSTYNTPTNTAVLTNKTFDTAGTGNVFKVNGTQISDKTGTGKVVLDTSPVLTTPNIGAATGASAIVTGRIDGTIGMVLSTAGSATTISSTGNSASYYMNQGDSDAHSVYTLPTAAAGLQYCVKNYTGISRAIKIVPSATGQYIDVDGTLTTNTTGYVISGGAAGDGACVVGVDSTHWVFYSQKGTWTRN